MIVTLVAARAAADEIRSVVPDRATYLLPGLTLGGTSSFGLGTGFDLGGEISLVHLRKPLFVGLLLDGTYDWRREGGRLMLGAEVGWGPFGWEVGYALELRDGGSSSGVAGGIFVSLGVVMLRVRYVGLVGAADAIEWSIGIKIPLRLSPRGSRSRPKREPSTAPASSAASRGAGPATGGDWTGLPCRDACSR